VGNRYLEKIALSLGQISTIGVGAALGGAMGYYGSKKKYPDQHPAIGAVQGGIIGAILGGLGHSRYIKPKGFVRSKENLEAHIDNIGADRNTKTKEEVRRAYKTAVMKIHPDRRPPHEREVAGEEFKKLQDSWDKVKKSDWFDKLAYVNLYITSVLGDSLETKKMSNRYLEKIASFLDSPPATVGGAALGGAIGYYYDKKKHPDSSGRGAAFRGAVTGATLGSLGQLIHEDRHLLFNAHPRRTGLDVHLNTIGASPDAKTKEEVERAYKSVVEKWHPDFQPPEKQEEAKKNFRKFRDSWDEIHRSKWFKKLATVNPYIASILED